MRWYNTDKIMTDNNDLLLFIRLYYSALSLQLHNKMNTVLCSNPRLCNNLVPPHMHKLHNNTLFFTTHLYNLQ